MRKGAQQQQQQQTPENSSDANETPIGGKETPPEEAVEGNVGNGNNVNISAEEGESCLAPGFLSDDEIATLGAPSGDDIDPAMTAIFKVRQHPAQQGVLLLACCVRSTLWPSECVRLLCTFKCIYSRLFGDGLAGAT